MDRTDPMIPDDVKNRWHIGLIAQEVLSINPHCISEWNKPTGEARYAINYIDFVTHLIGAAQEHNKLITAQQIHIATLQADETTMQTTIASLQSQLTTANSTISTLQNELTTMQLQMGQVLQRLAAAGIA
jgi:hypothetical protein